MQLWGIRALCLTLTPVKHFVNLISFILESFSVPSDMNKVPGIIRRRLSRCVFAQLTFEWSALVVPSWNWNDFLFI